jgi:hypothetical protein
MQKYAEPGSVGHYLRYRSIFRTNVGELNVVKLFASTDCLALQNISPI